VLQIQEIRQSMIPRVPSELLERGRTVPIIH
jgi:hypothetical protein